ncbi:MAG: hypothetical protein ACPIEU_10605, partial [Candidatus Puniceispirillaceae bacterium]
YNFPPSSGEVNFTVENIQKSIKKIEEIFHGEFSYDHPVFDERAILAQARLPEIQGHDNLFFAGAWTGYGFHEDGLKSAIAVVRSLNVEIPWQSDVAAYPLQDEEEREIA